jgi:uncharacterized tellurite resistance protein B-like protein
VVFQSIKSFVVELAGSAKPAREFDADDYRVAAAALLVHAARIDGHISDDERELLTDLVKWKFNLDDAATGELMEQAEVAEHEAIDLYQFTSLLIRALDQNARLRLIEMMWEIAYVDGTVTEFEDNLIWRAADLLGVSSHERIALRRRVAAVRGNGGA